MNSENVIVWVRQPFEAEVVRELNRHSAKYTVVKRCADITDARATVQAGLARILIADADALGLDTDFIDDMNQAGVFTLLLIEDAFATVNLGESAVCEYGNAADIVETLTVGIRQKMLGISPGVTSIAQNSEPPEAAEFAGKIIAFWGTHGAPGRSTMALNYAYQWGSETNPVTLVDADLQAPAQLQLVGEAPGGAGIAAALGLRNRGALDYRSVSEMTLPLHSGCNLLAGLNRADRWRQVSAEGLNELFTLIRRHRHLVVDLAAGIGEADPAELTFVPSKEDINRSVLTAADAVVLVGKADAVGLTRLGYALDDCQENGINVDLLLINRTPLGRKDRKLRQSIHRVLNRIAPNIPYVLIEETQAVAAALLKAEPVIASESKSSFVQSLNAAVTHLEHVLAEQSVAQ